MADYIYLLETRLTPAQQRAIGTVRTVARENDLTVFLTGGAVRDLTGGGSVRDLDITIQGDALRLKQPLQNAGAVIVGEYTDAQRLFLTFPGSVRAEVSSAMRVTYPKPGKPAFEPSNISEDLRSRDFTANAMAISLNEGSYGLLMDPLNGVADIENRELRLVSNYGFIEEPSRLIRAARLVSRLGWHMEERTRQRYDTAKDENYISGLNEWNRGYETEELFHEEDPLRILRALETEGWSSSLFPALQSEKANSTALAELADKQGQLQVQGIFAQLSALAFPLVTAKLTLTEVADLKGMFVRPGFAAQVDAMDSQVREFGTRISSKEAAAPSAAWKLLHEAEPNLVLAVYANSKAASVQMRIKTFLNDSPGARQRIPYGLLQEMRITPELPTYSALLDKLFFELMDGNLSTTEEMKTFLEPYSPPAPPPPVNLRRAKAKKEARPSRAKAKKAVEPDEIVPALEVEEEVLGLDPALVDLETLIEPEPDLEGTADIPVLDEVAPEPAMDAAEPPLGALPTNPPQIGVAAVAVAPVTVAEAAQAPLATQIPAKKPSTKRGAVAANDVPSSTNKDIAPASKSAPRAAKPAQKAQQAAEAKKTVGAARQPVTKSASKTPLKVAAPSKSVGRSTSVSPAKQQPIKAAAKKSSAAAKKPTVVKKVAPAKQASAPKKVTPAKKSVKAAKKAAGSAKKVAPPAKKSSSVAKKAPPPAKASSAAKKLPGKSAVKKASGRNR